MREEGHLRTIFVDGLRTFLSLSHYCSRFFALRRSNSSNCSQMNFGVLITQCTHILLASLATIITYIQLELNFLTLFCARLFFWLNAPLTLKCVYEQLLIFCCICSCSISISVFIFSRCNYTFSNWLFVTCVYSKCFIILCTTFQCQSANNCFPFCELKNILSTCTMCNRTICKFSQHVCLGGVKFNWISFGNWSDGNWTLQGMRIRLEMMSWAVFCGL